MLHLGKAGVTLDDNPRFLLWLNYVDMYSGLRYRSFSDDQVLQLLQKSNSDEQLVALLQSLRKVPSRKASAEQMQIYLFEESAASRELLNAAWLQSRETPENVYKMLHLERARLNVGKLEENSKFLQWFKYTEMYWPPAERDVRTFNFLVEKYGKTNFHLAPLLQSLKQTSNLDNLGDNLQNFLFMTWLDKNFTPKFVQSQLALPWGTTIFKLPKNDVLYRALEEYTIYYTARRGKEDVQKIVNGLFANDMPDEALAAAMKLLH
ncbi:hypothetical protein PR003_g22398 [Phytophthora rubi]|uniref:Uncharacterized protein n=1 Tax=Phytophthora rubi TaxID=129364 RepID=A0A6A3GSU5_9STRA|nr:hypothetical protein PR002_g30358 [Phytophthora rubi]KAE8960045.1 hypothetical protein PR001_g30516 [Phytophthora rubi]KAE9301985.1 hypothetical protein PR003_g22398 [Phytophthora rubi]